MGHTHDMAETHVISALVKKRSEMAGGIENTHKKLPQLIADFQKLELRGCGILQKVKSVDSCHYFHCLCTIYNDE